MQQNREQYTYEQLKKLIIGGELKPLDQLLQIELATRFNVSRTPLRAAIAQLERDGFVETTGRGEAFVRQYDTSELASIVELRALLEGLVCRYLAETIHVKHLAYLDSLVRTSLDDDQGVITATHSDMDLEFHDYLCQLVDDRIVKGHLANFQISDLALKQDVGLQPSENISDHFAILDAMKKRDAALAESLMVAHHRKVAGRLRSTPLRLGTPVLQLS
jgi:DNA-binding GntR family transcriptional regulator